MEAFTGSTAADVLVLHTVSGTIGAAPIEYTYALDTRHAVSYVSGPGPRRYTGEGNRHERRKQAAKRRRAE